MSLILQNSLWHYVAFCGIVLKREEFTTLMSYKCEFCNTLFSKKYSMYKHQRTARYCLALQDKPLEKYNCISCNKFYSRRDALLRHQKECEKDLKNSNQDELLLKVIDKYGEMVKDLQKQISDLAINRQASNSNNRNMVMNNLQPITDANLQEHLEHLSLDFIKLGAKGYADFAGNYPLKDKVICTDKARKKLKYKNEEGLLTDDGRTLAQRFFQAISERNSTILNQAYANLHHERQGIVADNRAGEVDVTEILTKATALQDILIKSERVARGEDDDFAQEFLSHLSKML